MNSETQGQNDPEFGQRGTWLINESGLYSLILSSKLPKAKTFKRWVTSEVLPAIRKTGSYGISSTTKEEIVNVIKKQALEVEGSIELCLQSLMFQINSKIEHNYQQVIGQQNEQIGELKEAVVDATDMISAMKEEISVLSKQIESCYQQGNNLEPITSIKEYIKVATQNNMSYKQAYQTLYKKVKHDYGVNLFKIHREDKEQKAREGVSPSVIHAMTFMDTIREHPETWTQVINAALDLKDEME